MTTIEDVNEVLFDGANLDNVKFIRHNVTDTNTTFRITSLKPGNIVIVGRDTKSICDLINSTVCANITPIPKEQAHTDADFNGMLAGFLVTLFFLVSLAAYQYFCE